MILLIIIALYILYTDHIREKSKRTTQSSPSPSAFLASASPDKKRLYTVGFIILGVYSATFMWLHFAWYRLYKQSKMHWFSDAGEWNQLDKAGHVFSAYFETVWAYELLRWAGLDNKRAAYTAAFIGMGFESSIEVWDSFSTKWGASKSDLGANFIGVSMALAQYLLWEEQRIMCKVSYNGFKHPHPDGELSERADELFGKSFLERAVKDYNNMTIWLSINPSKFIPAIKPDWLCLAVGYGSENLYGGFENKWTGKNGKQHDRSELPRNRVVKFSLDADLPRLRKNDPAGKAAFQVFNIVKMPFPSYKIRF